MAYNANIPQPNDLISQSQADLLNNFQALQTLIDVNHVDFASADQGKHKFVEMPVQSVAPVFAAGEVGLYNLLYGVSGVNEMFVKNQAGQATPFTAVSKTTPGWAWLPCGLLIKWGADTANGLTTNTFPVGVNIPAFTQILTMQITTGYPSASDGNGFVRLNNFVAPWTQFTTYGSQRTTTTNQAVAFTYLAIGF